MISPAQLKLVATCEVVATLISDTQAEEATRYLMGLPAKGGGPTESKPSELEERRQDREIRPSKSPRET